MMIQKKKTICPLDCPDSCGIIASIESGRVIKLEGDPDHEITKGFICRKMKSYPRRIAPENRVLHPLLRSGPKGSASFQRIPWDKAWQMMVDRLSELKQNHGGEALLPYSFAGNMGHIGQKAGLPFFNKFGASKLGNTICSAAAKAGWKAHLGDRPGSDPQKAAEASLIVAWGINVKVTNVHFWPMIQQSRKNGGKLVVIDPYKNITGQTADVHFMLRPGGDTALALGALKLIVERKGHNKAFINSFTTGFEKLKHYVAELDWKEIENNSGLERPQIEQFTELLLENPKTFIRIGIGLSRNSRGAMSVRAISCLALALGLLENSPGKGILLSAGGFNGNSDKLTFPELSATPTRTINMVQLGNALTTLNPKVHGLFVYNSNPLSVAPEASKVKKGLMREDLFTIVHEQVMTPTARYADLVLPATTFLESRDVYTAYGHFYMGTTEPLVPAPGEAIDNFTLFQTLAEKMGYTDPPFQQSLDDRILDYLSDMKGLPPDFSAEKLKPGDVVKSVYADADQDHSRYLPYRFVSHDLSPGQPEFPHLGPLAENDDEELKQYFPLTLIAPPNGRLLNSTFGDLYRDERGKLLIHPEAAQARKIKNGQKVLVYNHRGSIIRTADITENTRPDLVVAEGIYWENPELQIQGVNELTSQRTADLAGGGTFHESRVEVNIA